MLCFILACKWHLVPFMVKQNMYLCVWWHMSQEWAKLEKPEGAPWPVERTAHAACCLNYGEENPQMLVTGGLDKNGTTLQDVWILDVKSRRWRKVSVDAHTNVWLVQLTECAVQIMSMHHGSHQCNQPTDHKIYHVYTNFQQ